MLTIRPTPTDLCRGLNRRDWIRIGFSGALGLSGSAIIGNRPAAAERSGSGGFGRARSCILVYLFGGPSHLDIWDLKPDAPAGIRGEFKPISTNVPGVRITEHLPRLARLADRYALIRSMSHGDNTHGSASHAMLTGRLPRTRGEVPPTPDDSPTYGSVIARFRPPAAPLPPFVAMPTIIRTSTNLIPGQDGGLLGRGWDPFRLEPLKGTMSFVPPELASVPRAAVERLKARQALLSRLDRGGPLRQAAAGRELDILDRRAFDLLSSPHAAAAFRLDREPARVRERYGMNLFGQSLLLARRLAEAGVPLITVFWPNREEPEAFNNAGKLESVAVPPWDTHGTHVGNSANFPMLKDRLLPPLDRASSALIEDLAVRGMLGQTLVVWTGEFGRTPRINGDAGRDHYGTVFSVMLAGGGIRGGQVIGASDRFGAFPAERPVAPGDLAASIYAAMGIWPDTEITDRLGRPFRIADGTPIARLWTGA